MYLCSHSTDTNFQIVKIIVSLATEFGMSENNI